MGTLNGQSGTFPCNYVEPHVPTEISTVHPSPSVSSMGSDVSYTSHAKPLVARVTLEYEAAHEKELSLKLGQYIKVLCVSVYLSVSEPQVC